MRYLPLIRVIPLLLLAGALSGCSQGEKANAPGEPSTEVPHQVSFPLPTGFTGLRVIPFISSANATPTHVVVADRENVPGFLLIVDAEVPIWLPVGNATAISEERAEIVDNRLVVAFTALLTTRQQVVQVIEWLDGKATYHENFPYWIEKDLTGLALADGAFVTTSSRNFPTGLQELWRLDGATWTKIPHPEPLRFAADSALATDGQDLFLCDDRSDGSIVVHRVDRQGTLLETATLAGASQSLSAPSLPACREEIGQARVAFSWLEFEGLGPASTIHATFNAGDWATISVANGFNPRFSFHAADEHYLAGNPWNDNEAQALLIESHNWQACQVNHFGTVPSGRIGWLAWVDGQFLVTAPIAQAISC